MEAKKRATLQDWQAVKLRLTAFPAEGAENLQPDWWNQIVGAPSETKVLRAARAEFQEEGALGSGRLALTIIPGRVDWNYVPSVGEDRLPKPWIDSVPLSMKSFEPLMTKWLEISPDLARLAFGAIMELPVESRQMGYEFLASYLHSVDVDTKGSSDLFYQINRPRHSTLGIEGLEINRLSKWAVAVLQRVSVSMGPDGVYGHTSDETATAVRLELDINTSPHFVGPLPRNRLGEILRELVTLGWEIAEKGDVP